MINKDRDVRDLLKVVFIPNFSVTHGQQVYPAAELSEQISLAGKEASGTGNMKFAMNGALTIGTLDGANVEIREQVGEENFFMFGMTTDDVRALRESGYVPSEYYRADGELRAAIDLIANGYFSKGDRDLFAPLVADLLDHDPYMLLADYASYVDCQSKVNERYTNAAAWNRMSILNTARSGHFSSDRAIREYQEGIWKVKAVQV